LGSAYLNERDAVEIASFPSTHLTDMTSLHICYWETVGATGPAAVGSCPIEGAPSERAARRKFHRETITDAGSPFIGQTPAEAGVAFARMEAADRLPAGVLAERSQCPIL